jgi:hypothetical protein
MNKKKYLLYFIVAFVWLTTEGVAQVAINADGSQPSANTILDLNPAVGKAFLPPTMNWGQIKAISPAKAGMVVYDSEFNCLRMYNGSKWVRIGEQADLNAIPGSFTTQTADGNIVPRNLITDASGNVYIVGYFSGTVTFGSLTPLTSTGATDIFVTKYNNNGIPQWVQMAGGTLGDGGFGIALDASGNIYINGFFTGTATFGSLTPLTSAGNSDVFVAKYNNSGTPQWVRQGGGLNSDYSTKIVSDASGNVYIIGFFQGSATFGSLAPITGLGLYDCYIVKYNTSGTALWAQKASVSSGGAIYGNSVGLDASGNVYITGYFYGTATFGSLAPIASIGSGNAIFVARLISSDGFFAWVQSPTTNFNGGGGGNDIALDALGNVYLTGSFYGTATFGSLPSITSSGASDIFVAKYNSSGVAQWIKQAGGSTNNDEGIRIALDASVNIYITGYFNGTATFGTLPPLTSLGAKDIFIAKYNSNGVEQWVQKAGGIGSDEGSSIMVDAFGTVYTIGIFTPSAQFVNQVFTSGKMFLIKYAE